MLNRYTIYLSEAFYRCIFTEIGHRKYAQQIARFVYICNISSCCTMLFSGLKIIVKIKMLTKNKFRSKTMKKSDFNGGNYFKLSPIHYLVYLVYVSSHSYTISIMANWGGLRIHLKPAPFQRAEKPYLGCH